MVPISDYVLFNLHTKERFLYYFVPVMGVTIANSFLILQLIFHHKAPILDDARRKEVSSSNKNQDLWSTSISFGLLMPKFDRMIVLFCKPPVRASTCALLWNYPWYFMVSVGCSKTSHTSYFTPHVERFRFFSLCHTALTIGWLPFCETRVTASRWQSDKAF